MSFPATNGIRVLIVDDHAMFREGLVELLGKAADITVVGRCASPAEALRLLPGTRPTIVLLDFDLGVERAFDFRRVSRSIVKQRSGKGEGLPCRL